MKKNLSHLSGIIILIFFVIPTPSKALEWAWPTTAKSLSQTYYEEHRAIDIDGEKADPVYAAATGIVAKRGRDEAYGKYIILKHANGFKTKYAHLRKIMVEKRQEVRMGAKIGKIGMTGWSTGFHLHFELSKDGELINPLQYKYIRKYLQNL